MKYLLVIFFIFNSITASAKDSETEKLIKGCNELVGIYKNHKEKRLMSSMLASSSDALLAGYCMGITKSLTALSINSCGRRDWYQLAESIANEWDFEPKKISLDIALRRVCR